MKFYIISQVCFFIIICILRILQILYANKEYINQLCWSGIVVISLIMVFVQGYLKAYFCLNETLVSIIYISAAILFAFFNVIMEKIRGLCRTGDGSKPLKK